MESYDAVASWECSLRLLRFRVARSGRVFGLNGDSLDIFVDDVGYNPKYVLSSIRVSPATRSPDGRVLSLSLFSEDLNALSYRRSMDDHTNPEKVDPVRPHQLDLDLLADDDDTSRVTVSPLPPLTSLYSLMPTWPISAAGKLWAPYLTRINGSSHLVMYVKGADKWVEVDIIALPKVNSTTVLRGFAVVGQIILVSLLPSHLFFAFNTQTCTWAQVITPESARRHEYIPIHDRSVFVEEDGTIYFLKSGTVYAYQLDWHGTVYQMKPPTKVDCVFPFRDEGNSFLTHLGGRVMCSVWISSPAFCGCHAKHALITTFRVNGDGLDVLHSTSRWLDMRSSKAHGSICDFSFLQEYEEFNHHGATPPSKKKRENVMAPSVLLKGPASSNIKPPSQMISCCRNFFSGVRFSTAFVLEPSAILTKKALYTVCQAASCTTVYKIDILGGRFLGLDKILRPHCKLEAVTCDKEGDMMKRPLPWHFLCDNEYIYAAPRMLKNEAYACSLREENSSHPSSSMLHLPGVAFHLILRVGTTTFALSDNLQCVYRMFDANNWVPCETSVPPHYQGKKVRLSGYVVVSARAFVVSDAESDCSFLLDLEKCKWSIVKPYKTEISSSYWPRGAFLRGRSLFSGGFIYTCADGGLLAYELFQDDDSCYLGNVIYLEFSWGIHWMRDHMCIEYIGQNTISGTIMFCVVQDDTRHRSGYSDDIWCVGSTTVQVETEKMPCDKQRPKKISHVDIALISVEWSGSEVKTRNCFAADPFS